MKTVLVVDGDSSIARPLSLFLKDNHRIIAVSDTQQALEKVTEDRPDIWFY